MPSSPLPRHLWPREIMHDPEPMPRSFEARADAIHRGNTPPVMRGWSKGATGTPRVELPMPPELNPRLVVPMAKAGGEGSRGGKIIGHTRSGKPIYASTPAYHPSYAGFSVEDHADALVAHEAHNPNAHADNHRITEGHFGEIAVLSHPAHTDPTAKHYGNAKTDADKAQAVRNSARAKALALQAVDAARRHAREIRLKKGSCPLHKGACPDGCAMGKAIGQTAVRAAGRAFGAVTSFGMGKSDDDEDHDDAGDKALGETVESAVLRHLLANEQHENMAKAGGEGSRGGKIIGHTRSGKPIYEHSATHSSFTTFSAQDHKDAARVHTLHGADVGRGNPAAADHHATQGEDHERMAEVLAMGGRGGMPR